MEKTLNQAKNMVKNETLFFSDALKQIVSDFSKRSQEIIFSRFGVMNSGSFTLEEIGKKYSITRERVRQVVHEVLKKVREKNNHPAFLRAHEEIIFAIRSNGGIIEKKKLLSKLGRGNSSEEASVNFFLECQDAVICHGIKGELKHSCALSDFNFEKWREIKDFVLKILKSHKQPLSFSDLLKHSDASLIKNGLTEDILLNYIEVSEEIKKNVFEKWGIAEWREISPKGTRGKAYLILKESNKPLHFREIAKKIDQFSLNKKKTHPQTVHNELIKDKDFILVGRGIYALQEWGYKSGTVKDVIEEIFKNAGRPMMKEEIISKVLEVRQVKKSTIVINLNNYFSKSKNGTYSLKK